MKFILHRNVKTPTIAGILTFISTINKTNESSDTRIIFIFHNFTFYEQLNFYAQLSMKRFGILTFIIVEW